MGERDFTRPFTKVVIAVDPPTGDGTCGIIACAKDEADTAHILADHSVTAVSPEVWARAVATAVRIWALVPPRNDCGVGLPPAIQVQSGGLDDPTMGDRASRG
jgi:phage terminase large subunit-like protein